MAKPLSDAKKAQICARFLNGETQGDLAREFGVALNTVCNILKRAQITAAMRAEVKSPEPPPPESPREFLEDYEGLEDPPEDPLDLMSWMQGALAVSAKHALRDPTFRGNEAARRKELRDIAQAMAKVTPIDALADARKKLQKDRDELEKGSGPGMVDVSARKRKRPRIAAATRKP